MTNKPEQAHQTRTLKVSKYVDNFHKRELEANNDREIDRHLGK